jgi:LCP family protein required for cell wall assembly
MIPVVNGVLEEVFRRAIGGGEEEVTRKHSGRGTVGRAGTSKSDMDHLRRLHYLKRKRWLRRLRLAACLVLLGSLVAGVLNLGQIKVWAAKHYLKFRFNPAVIKPEEEPDLYARLSSWHDPKQLLNILVIGIDKGSIPEEDMKYYRSDVMMLASVNVDRKKAVVVSIPRDTKVKLEGHGTEKINAAHAYNGPAGAVEAVEELTGMEVHHYAEVDFDAFKNIVNAIGGVPFHLDFTINDPLVGYLPKGDYILNGDQALIVVRSRKLPRGDLDRIENQKKFMKALMEKALSIRDTRTLLNLLDATVKYLNTTLQPEMIFTLAELLQGMKTEDVEFATIPGDSPKPAPGQPWYFIHNQEETRKLFENVKKYCSVKGPVEEAAAGSAGDLVEKLTVAVLNGARVDGLAGRVSDYLKDYGFTVAKVGNASQVYSKTRVFYSGAAASTARKLADALDIDPSALSEDSAVTGKHQVGVVLVLGKDFKFP